MSRIILPFLAFRRLLHSHSRPSGVAGDERTSGKHPRKRMGQQRVGRRPRVLESCIRYLVQVPFAGLQAETSIAWQLPGAWTGKTVSSTIYGSSIGHPLDFYVYGALRLLTRSTFLSSM